MSRTWCPRLLRENWGEMKSVSIYSWLCHFSNNYKKNLNKEEMHQAKSLGIISPVFSFMTCDMSSLVISLNERILITFSLNPLCQPVHAGISMTKEVIMSVFRVFRPKFFKGFNVDKNKRRWWDVFDWRRSKRHSSQKQCVNLDGCIKKIK